jgi:hypothetical protein
VDDGQVGVEQVLIDTEPRRVVRQLLHLRLRQLGHGPVVDVYPPSRISTLSFLVILSVVPPWASGTTRLICFWVLPSAENCVSTPYDFEVSRLPCSRTGR